MQNKSLGASPSFVYFVRRKFVADENFHRQCFYREGNEIIYVFYIAILSSCMLRRSVVQVAMNNCFRKS